MIDDLRNSANSEPFEPEPLNDDFFNSPLPHEEKRFLGMSAGQRFVIALFLFLMVAILGGFILIVFQKIYPPV